ncbi:hypothetical protein ACFQ3C_17955 [Seohaeicola saemankumensis]|uniref:Uncharacterized protein n=1 Tax=Seohaeicola saemankumensis TaxID=481181 RepID=A0ABW3TIQ1_9RHOB
MQRLYRFLVEKNPDAARRAASAIRDRRSIFRERRRTAWCPERGGLV